MKITILNEGKKSGLVGPLLINKTPVHFDPKQVKFFCAKTGRYIRSEKIAEMAKPHNHLIPYVAGLLMYGKSKGMLREEQIVFVREKLGRTDAVKRLAEQVIDKIGKSLMEAAKPKKVSVSKKAATVYGKKPKREQPAWKPAIESIEAGDMVKVDSNHGGGVGTVMEMTKHGRYVIVKFPTGRIVPFHESLLTIKKKLSEAVEPGQVVSISSNAGAGVGEVVSVEGDYAMVKLPNHETGKFHIKDLQPKSKILGEKAPPGMENWIKDRKKEFKDRYGDDWEENLYATAWKIYNKKNESVKEQSISRKSPPPGMEDWVESKKMEYIRKYGRQWEQHAIEDAWELHTSKTKAGFL